MEQGRRFALSVCVLLTLIHGAHGAAQAQTSTGENSQKQFRIAGTVVNKAGGALLAEARVTLQNTDDPKNVQSMLTGEDGRFEFHVMKGKYALLGAKRGFINGGYDQHEQFSTAIVTGSGLETENLVLRLAPLAVLSGKVLDETGEPIRGAQVTLWRENHNAGISRITQFRSDSTDDLGGYEFAPLIAGTYFLSVSARPWYAVHPTTMTVENTEPVPVAVDRALDVVYPTTYYSGATDSDEATPIPIQGGDRVELDFHLAPVPALHIVFRGEQKENNFLPPPLLRRRAFDSTEPQRFPEEIQTTPAGVVEMSVAPGRYTVSSRGENGRSNDVDISEDHQQLDISKGEALHTMNAIVRIEGSATIPRDLVLMLRESQKTLGFGEVNGRGEVKFASVAPGKYEVVAGSQGKFYAVTGITCDGKASSGHTLNVTEGSSLSATFTLEEGSESVQGFVTKAGKPVAGAMVVLVPKNPQMNTERFRRDQSDLDGSFLLRGVIPGTYTAVAIADGWELDWSRAAVIAHYLRTGKTVVVSKHVGHPIHVAEPIEVQAK
jgi:5-hydroxyisourate hydrolase-like protein (transthyretin family)